jgi:large subunit ribosomal protein L4
MEIKIFDISGKETKSVVLKDVDGHKSDNGNNDLYLLDCYQRTRKRLGTAACKGRSDVRGGGAKPYNQKGTGNARRGTNRSPLRRGGGVIFGPQQRPFNIKINKKQAKHSFLTLLSGLAGKIIGIENDSVLKTKDAEKFLATVRKTAKVEGRRMLFVTDGDKSQKLLRAFRNIAGIQCVDFKTVEVNQFLNNDLVILANDTVGLLEKRATK